ncbi:MAG: EmrB/QacA subfamily drug resistance transporter [Acidimicrobiales bacterium]|jgi:EmrB/QacA subfamily drug resistance transporter
MVPKRAWRALAVGAAGYVLFGFNSTATNLGFGAISDSFESASEGTLSWVASGYFIATAAFLPLGGRLADRVGRRKIFNIGLAGFTASAILSAVAPTIWLLIAARVAQAISGAMVIPSSLAMVLPEFPIARRSSAVAYWAASGPLSAAVAPSTAALLLDATSWRWLYFLSAPLAATFLVLSIIFVSDTKGDDDGKRLDLAGTGLAVGAVAMLIVGISQANSWGWGSWATILVIFEALAMGVLFVVRSANHPAPLVNLTLFRIPEIAIANLANLFISVTSLSIWLIWPLWLGRVWGYSTAQIGLAITIGPVFAGPAAILGGKLVEKYGPRWLMIIGTAISTAAVLWSFFMLGTESNYVVSFMPSVAGFGFGWGLSNPSMNSWALAHAPQDFFGEVNASFNTLRNLAAAIGTAAAIAIVGAADRPDTLQAYQRANLFFAFWVGLSCLTVTVGTFWLARRPAT